MDVNCPRCAEPCDIYEFHDLAAEQGTTFDAVRRTFFTEGCGIAFGGRQCEKVESLTADASAVLYDLLGDDVDGIAAMLEDFDYMGMLD